jgi:hypothetical protein
MRQVFVGIPLFFLFLFVLYLFTPHLPHKTRPESFINPDVLVMVKHYDLAERINSFRRSRLGKVLENINYIQIAKDIDFDVIDIETITYVEQELKKLTSDPLLKELFGKELTIALFPFAEHTSSTVQQQLLDNIVILARPKHSARLLDIVSNIVPATRNSTNSSYGGYIIKRIPVNDQLVIAASRVNDLLLLSYNERLLRSCLDTYDDKKAQITNKKWYQELQGDFKQASLSGYINLQKLTENTTELVTQTNHALKDFLLTELSRLQGFKTIFFGVWQQNDHIFDKTMITFDREEIREEFKELVDIKPSYTDSYHYLSADTIWYYWTNGLQPESMYKHFKQERGSSEDSLFSELSDVIALDLEDFLSLIDNDFTLAVKNIPEYQFVPAPRLMLAVKLHNVAATKAAIDKLLSHYDVPVRTQTVKNVELTSLGGIISTGEILPSFALFKDYLIISSNIEQIKEFITGSKSIPSLRSSKYFNEINTGLTKKNNSIGYLHFAEVTNMLKELVNWGGTIIGIQDREAARKSKIVIDQLINPLLDGLAMYSQIGTRRYTQNNRIYIESTTIIEKQNQ